ncbi:hypothetical protein Ppa06_00920 [Planomonospora parontospora subsp. parontospora]|uniref:Sarcosine oxidase subunit alpha n=2 Tax=Planomonospora parontospora TaxID=58119 RepID=A0AA37BB26_9ACTN|nr:2Fe-2S iron-sulfur cluster-binding protein [Planomonospora parontospora]GGK45215.1 hypothetical protein GCM10010126_00920 [Planomonospora parontospora]GII06294.1 hypothetical protein Ppa06_00920 [Planomonospora parontospora subsp. parontospora]
MTRAAAGGRIDRSRVLRFRFDGRDLTGHPGDTLASALLAAGVRRVATSVRFGRPRGIFSAGPEEPNAIVQIEEPFPEPMLTATTVELYDGLVARGLSGRGRLADRPDPARYDAVHAHCDVLVVGAGPAGLSAARAAAADGARVIVADEQPEPGGVLLGLPGGVPPGSLAPPGAVPSGSLGLSGALPLVSGESAGPPGAEWAAATAAELSRLPEVRVLPRTTVVGHYDGNHLVAVERRTAHLGAAAPAWMARERVWRIRARRVVLATGAHERPIAFAGNDLPGVMLAGAARTYANRYAVLPGRRAVVFTTDDAAYAAALDLAGAGVRILAVADARPGPNGRWRERVREHGIEVLAGGVVAEARGTGEVTSVVTGDGREFEADLLLVSGGWNPVVHLFCQVGGTVRFDDGLQAFVPDTPPPAVEVAGAARGLTSLHDCLADGAAAGTRAAEALGGGGSRAGTGRPGTGRDRQAGGGSPERRGGVRRAADGAPQANGHALWLVPADDCSTHFVDLQRDVTVADIRRATGAGLRSVEHVKRHTTAGTAHDQGKTSGTLVPAIVAGELGVHVREVGVTSFRPPYTPVSFAALAGRDRGALHDPVRVTPMHGWHVERGAVFENAGQWKRPRYYPREGEDMAAAVLRECRAVRGGAGAMDVSTLGKIEVRGPDAAGFLDRLYTNLMGTLRPGSIRYGVMCRADGMVFDDGTVIRLAEDRFLATTTTGNAAAVLDWMEEWLQTEWPSLRVYCTSVTEQWATVALAGPAARDVLSGLAPRLAADAADFPFMTWRDTEVAGMPARVCRISFSGELAYEINVGAWHGPALWSAVLDTGRVTPYGTEAMHVLRAEKGYPIIGQDTDGTVTPADLGMEWMISKKKADFVGRRSLTRADTVRRDRRHLVGLLPEDPGLLIPEGTQLVEHERLPAPPVRSLGHVTSSYLGAGLGRTFALALVSGGRDRIGDRIFAVLDGGQAPVAVASPVLYDPEGARRDG